MKEKVNVKLICKDASAYSQLSQIVSMCLNSSTTQDLLRHNALLLKKPCLPSGNMVAVGVVVGMEAADDRLVAEIDFFDEKSSKDYADIAAVVQWIEHESHYCDWVIPELVTTTEPDFSSFNVNFKDELSLCKKVSEYEELGVDPDISAFVQNLGKHVLDENMRGHKIPLVKDGLVIPFDFAEKLYKHMSFDTKIYKLYKLCAELFD